MGASMEKIAANDANCLNAVNATTFDCHSFNQVPSSSVSNNIDENTVIESVVFDLVTSVVNQLDIDSNYSNIMDNYSENDTSRLCDNEGDLTTFHDTSTDDNGMDNLSTTIWATPSTTFKHNMDVTFDCDAQLDMDDSTPSTNNSEINISSCTVISMSNLDKNGIITTSSGSLQLGIPAEEAKCVVADEGVQVSLVDDLNEKLSVAGVDRDSLLNCPDKFDTTFTTSLDHSQLTPVNINNHMPRTEPVPQPQLSPKPQLSPQPLQQVMPENQNTQVGFGPETLNLDQFMDNCEAINTFVTRRRPPNFPRMSIYRQFDPLATPVNQGNQSRADEHKPESRSSSDTKVVDNRDSLPSTGYSFLCNTPFASETTDRLSNGHHKLWESPSKCTPRSSAKPDVLLSATDHDADKTIKEQQAEIRNLQEMLNTKQDELNASQNRCKEYRQLIEQISLASNSLVQEFEKRIKEKMVQITDLNRNYAILLDERNRTLEDIHAVEESFENLQSRYQRLKGALELSKTNEELLQGQNLDIQEQLSQAQEKLQSANAAIQEATKANDREMMILRAQLKRAELKIVGLQGQVDQKSQENQELTQMVDDLSALKG